MRLIFDPKNSLYNAAMKSLEKGDRVPLIALIVDTLFGLLAFGLSGYHYTQPEGAWRSGTAEVLCGILILLGAYFLSMGKTAFINFLVAAVVLGIGIRHLIHGNGWRSGITEIGFSCFLTVAGLIILRTRKTFLPHTRAT